jgi:hypothetical protein
VRRTIDPPRPGFKLADEFVAEHPTLVEVRAEQDRLRLVQRDSKGEQAAWLLGQTGADYRLGINRHLSRLEAEENRRQLALQRQVQAEAKGKEMTVDEKLARLERLVKRLGLDAEVEWK